MLQRGVQPHQCLCSSTALGRLGHDGCDERCGTISNYIFHFGQEAMQDWQPMNRHLNRCEKVDGQSGMTIQRRFNDDS
jgi:hypothetical protein